MKHRICILLVFLFLAPMAAAQDSGWFATAQFGGGLDYSLTRHFGVGAELQASSADYLAGRFVLRYSF